MRVGFRGCGVCCCVVIGLAVIEDIFVVLGVAVLMVAVVVVVLVV